MLHSEVCPELGVMAMKEVLRQRLDGEELTEALVLIRTRAPDLESVRKLNCWACNIGDVNVVRRMPNLEVCSLTINKLTSLRDFAHCVNLQELYVRTNNIQHLSDVHYLKNLKKLRALWLSENPCASSDNYRLTVLKVLPNLQKLDNVAVTREEIARAQSEGDYLPLPEDFSFSGEFKDTSFSPEEMDPGSHDSQETENVSSSERWARPRQRRQQRKREDYWREKRGVEDDSGSAKSGDDVGGSVGSVGEGGAVEGHSLTHGGDGAGGEGWGRSEVWEESVCGYANDELVRDSRDDQLMRSSRTDESVGRSINHEPVIISRNDESLKSSRNVEPMKSSRNDEPLKSSRKDNLGQAGEEEKTDNKEDCDVQVDDNDEVKTDPPSTRSKWALSLEVRDNISDVQEKLEIENLDNIVDYGKGDNVIQGGSCEITGSNEAQSNTNDSFQAEESNEAQINTDGSFQVEELYQNDGVQDSSVESCMMGIDSSVSGELFKPDVFHGVNFDAMNFTDNGLALVVSDGNPLEALATSVASGYVAGMAFFDSNANASVDYDPEADGVKGDQLLLEGHLGPAGAPSVEVIEQVGTPLLDKTNLEDTLDVMDVDKGERSKSQGSAGQRPELDRTLPEAKLAQTSMKEAISSHPEKQSVSDSRDPVNWDEYNHMRVQLGVAPVHRIPITARSINSETVRTRNANILQAVLCLIKELDKDSLDIVASVVRSRLDGT